MFRQVAQLALARVASLMLRDAALHAIGCKPEMMALATFVWMLAPLKPAWTCSHLTLPYINGDADAWESCSLLHIYIYKVLMN